MSLIWCEKKANGTSLNQSSVSEKLFYVGRRTIAIMWNIGRRSVELYVSLSVPQIASKFGCCRCCLVYMFLKVTGEVLHRCGFPNRQGDIDAELSFQAKKNFENVHGVRPKVGFQVRRRANVVWRHQEHLGGGGDDRRVQFLVQHVLTS